MDAKRAAPSVAQLACHRGRACASPVSEHSFSINQPVVGLAIVVVTYCYLVLPLPACS